MPSVLIVDDVPSQSLTLALLCRSMGVESHRAATAAEACTIIEQVRPEAAIIDLVMPGADGLDCLFMISKLAPTMAVAVTTASDKLLLKAAAELTDSYGLKPVALMPKPIGVEELRAFLQQSGILPGGPASEDDDED